MKQVILFFWVSIIVIGCAVQKPATKDKNNTTQNQSSDESTNKNILKKDSTTQTAKNKVDSITQKADTLKNINLAKKDTSLNENNIKNNIAKLSDSLSNIEIYLKLIEKYPINDVNSIFINKQIRQLEDSLLLLKNKISLISSINDLVNANDTTKINRLINKLQDSIKRYNSFLNFLEIANSSNYSLKDSILLKANIKKIQDSLKSLNTTLDKIKKENNKLGSLKKLPKKEDIETTINYSANDSIYLDFKTKDLKMYGNTHLDYGYLKLEAARTDVNMSKKTINSYYITDSTNKKIGKPIFTENKDRYETENITYNFETKRAQIRGVVTEQQGGFLHGHNVKKNEENNMYVKQAKYTTCNMAEPHFYILSNKIKVIPGKSVVSGPFIMKFKEVIAPLGFPFGMFPQTKKRTSGVIFPIYGEETRRGFFLKNGGYYWAINNYMDFRATADLFTNGGSSFNFNSNFKKRYAFTGNANVSIVQNRSTEISNPLSSDDYWFRLNLNQDSRGSSRLSANVSLGTTSYNKNTNLVSQDFNRSINAQYSSSISYSKQFQNTPFSINLSMRQNQNLQTQIWNLTFPDFNLSTARQYPFKKLFKKSNNPIAKINFSHNFNASNQMTNIDKSSYSFKVANYDGTKVDTLEFFNDFDKVIKRSKNGGKHTVPISTSMTLLKYFTLSPSFNYQEVWYTKELKFKYISEQEAIQVDTVNGFSRAGWWSSGVSLNTIIYGSIFFKSRSKIQAIRHVMTPSISYNYNPDFSDPSRGVYQWVQRNEKGDSIKLSKYEGFIFGSPSGSESQNLSFSLQNTIEMKVRDDKDTTGLGYKKIKLIDNLSLSTGYNLIADSFKLSSINASTRFSFFKNKLGINISSVFDPYVYELLSEKTTPAGDRVVTQKRINRYTWNAGQGLGNLSSLSTAFSLSLAPPQKKKQKTKTQTKQPNNNNLFGQNDPNSQLSDFEKAELENIANNPEAYVDFKIPWTFRVSYNVNWSKTGFQDSRINQTLTFSGNFSLTPKTKITFNSGYDIKQDQFTTTSIGITRDLHCWGLSFNLVPFGRYQSFSIVLRPNSSILQDLQLQKQRSFLDFFGR